MVLAMMLHRFLTMLVNFLHVLAMVLVLLRLLAGSLVLGMASVRISSRGGLGKSRSGKDERNRADEGLHVKISENLN